MPHVLVTMGSTEDAMIDNLDEFVKLRDELNRRSDELNKRIQAFQDELTVLGIGLGTWVITEKDGNDTKTRVGYTRFQGAWQLVIEVRSHDEDMKKTTMPLLKASRPLRLHGYKHMRELLPQLLETARKFNEKLVNTLEGQDND